MTYSLIGNEKASFQVFRYGMFVITFGLPVIWIRRRFGLTKEVLGFSKGRISIPAIVFIGIGTALIFSVLFRISPFWRPTILDSPKIEYNILHLIFIPFSISGFASLVLSPIGEEVMFRGFIYVYLHRRLGLLLGLVTQALVFSLFHFASIYDDFLYVVFYRFVIGLILALLYEVTESIYPSIICHGLINYNAILPSL
jgi:membrane protease YdiL (CAAX protease family)